MSDNTTIRVSIGSEPMQKIPALVLRHSILSRTKSPVEFTSSWSDSRENGGGKPQGWHPIMRSAPHPKGGTEFAIWRWLVPALYGEGRAIYLDADQIVLTDIAELWHSLPEGKTIAAVCNAVGFFGTKTPEPNKVQTSVMVMDCALLKQRARVALHETGGNGKMRYKDLMQATWLPRDEVTELPPEWNHFGMYVGDGNPSHRTKLLHFSHVASQPWWNTKHPSADVWYRELRSAVEARVVTAQDLVDALERKQLDGYYINRLREDLDPAPRI